MVIIKRVLDKVFLCVKIKKKCNVVKMQYIKLLQKRGQLSSCAGCSHMHLPYNALENLKISAICK